MHIFTGHRQNKLLKINFELIAGTRHENVNNLSGDSILKLGAF